MKQQILQYLVAMNATAFDSAIHALVLFCGVAGADKLTGQVTAMDARQLFWIFLIAFGRAILGYLERHPVEGLLAQGAEAGEQRSEAARQAAPMLDGGGHQSAATSATLNPQAPQ